MRRTVIAPVTASILTGALVLISILVVPAVPPASAKALEPARPVGMLGLQDAQDAHAKAGGSLTFSGAFTGTFAEVPQSKSGERCSLSKSLATGQVEFGSSPHSANLRYSLPASGTKLPPKTSSTAAVVVSTKKGTWESSEIQLSSSGSVHFSRGSAGASRATIDATLVQVPGAATRLRVRGSWTCG